MNRHNGVSAEHASFAFLSGGGEMGERIRAFDWSASPVGPVARWPQALKTAVSICIGSRYPIVIWWGKQALTTFYNDAYIPFLGVTKHPGWLGRSGRECWKEIWPTIGPMLESVFATGEATWSEDLLLIMDRNLPREETYFTFSYSPIRDDVGAVGGIFCAVTETTGRVVGERRLRTLRDLGRTVMEAKSAEQACEITAQTLTANPADIPFALIYLLDAEMRYASLSAATGLAADSRAAPVRIDLRDAARQPATWPLRRTLDAGAAQRVSDLAAQFGPLPGGSWPESPETALVLPIAASGQVRPIGFLIAGLSPRRVVDADYLTFFDLIASHVSTAVANARAYEQEKRRAERKQAESLLDDQMHILEMIAKGKSLPHVLAAVVRTIEEQDPALLCSVLLLDNEGRRFRLGAAPSLPKSYLRGLDGLSIEPPYLGPCGMVLHSGQEVVVPDIETDERWSAQWRGLALSYGLRSCWSMPVFASDGRVAAAFTMYRRQPIDRAPSNNQLVQVATHLISIAIEQRQRLDALHRSEERSRLIVESAKEYAIFTTDLNGNVTSWNSGAKNMLGYDVAEIIGRSSALVFAPEDREQGMLERELEKARMQGQAENERWHVRKDGSRFWASGLVMPLKDNGSFRGFLKIIRDMTEQRQAAELLREEDRRKNEFLATLAHELRNPLAPLRNCLQIMKLTKNDAGTVERCHAMMERQLAQMTRLVDDLLDLGRISRGKLELRKDRVELAKVVQQAVETSSPLIEANGHDLTIHMPPLPIFVDADPTRLAQVISNLLNNAAKYTERGGQITLTVERQNGEAAVSVRDTGIGIPASMLSRVFEMFTQVDQSLEKAQGGLGIGLSLVKRLIEMHGGSIEAQSAGLGKGSEFVIRLPAMP